MNKLKSMNEYYKYMNLFFLRDKEKPKRPWRYQNCEFCLDNRDEYVDIVLVEDAEFLHRIKDTAGEVIVEGICNRVEFVQCLRCKRYWFNYFDESGVLIV